MMIKKDLKRYKLHIIVHSNVWIESLNIRPSKVINTKTLFISKIRKEYDKI